MLIDTTLRKTGDIEVATIMRNAEKALRPFPRAASEYGWNPYHVIVPRGPTENPLLSSEWGDVVCCSCVHPHSSPVLHDDNPWRLPEDPMLRSRVWAVVCAPKCRTTWTTIITPRGPTEDLLLCFRVQGLRGIKGRLSVYPLGSAIAKRQSFRNASLGPRRDHKPKIETITNKKHS